MNRTKIEWTEYTWGVVTGCLKGCPYCYGPPLVRRFPKNFPNGMKPTFYPERLSEPYQLKGNHLIFVASMGDLWGSWVNQEWIDQIIPVMKDCPQHQFQTLTKNPARMQEYSKEHPFPVNVWAGATIDEAGTMHKRIEAVRLTDAYIRFLSFEPLAYDLGYPDLHGISWIIIGARTNPLRLPEPDWIEHLMDAAATRRIPVFLKDNIRRNMRWELTRDPQELPIYCEAAGE